MSPTTNETPASLKAVILTAGCGTKINEEPADFPHDSAYRSDTACHYCELNKPAVHGYRGAPWTAALMFTGGDATTGMREKRIAPDVGDERFPLTNGDGLSDADLLGPKNQREPQRRSSGKAPWKLWE